MKEQEEKCRKAGKHIEELLLRVYSYQGSLIRRFYAYDWEKGADKEKLSMAGTALIEVVEKITPMDLRMLYYLKNLDGLSTKTFLEGLEKKYQLQCDMKNELYNTDKYIDPVKQWKWKRKSKNTEKVEKNP